MIKLTETQRNDLADKICREIQASEDAKGTLPRRWQRNKDIYECIPGVTNLNVVEGMEAYTLPFTRQKCDSIRGSVMADVTSLFPYVQVIEEGPDGTNSDNIEHSLMALAKKGGFDEALDYALLVAFLTNFGVLRVRPIKGHVFGENAELKEAVTGVEIDWHDPRDICCYPQYFGDFETAKTVGHRDYDLLYRVQQKMAKPGVDPSEGEYWYCELSGSDDPKSVDAEMSSGSMARRDRTQSDSPVSLGDRYVQYWNVITEQDLGDGYKKYLATVARTDRKLLNLQPYEYKENWYVEVRLLNSGKQVWSNDSVAQALQGPAMVFSDTHTTLLHGSYAAAFPPMGITAGALNTNTKKYGPGTVFELPADTKLQGFPISFNPGALPEEAESMLRLGDSVSGISQPGTGDNLQPGTTATEANMVALGQQAAKGRYTNIVSGSVERVFKLLYMFLKAHFDDLKQALGDAIPIQSAEEFSVGCRFEATGKSGASNPQILLSKLQMLYQMAQNPLSQFDQAKIEDRVVQGMDLPFNVEGLKKEPDTEFIQMGRAMASQGMDPKQALQQGIQAMQKQAQDAQKPPAPVKPPVEMISYKDAPPSIQAQMEMQAGMTPAPEHERAVNIEKTNHLIDKAAELHNQDRQHEQTVVTADRSHELAVKAANKPVPSKK